MLIVAFAALVSAVLVFSLRRPAPSNERSVSNLSAPVAHGVSAVSPIVATPELKVPAVQGRTGLRELRRDYPASPYVFVSELGGPLTPATFRKLLARAGVRAKLPFPIHPHMLRHSTGFKLANDGHDTRAIQQYLGHRNITHTVRYTELSPERFKNFWKD